MTCVLNNFVFLRISTGHGQLHIEIESSCLIRRAKKNQEMKSDDFVLTFRPEILFNFQNVSHLSSHEILNKTV